MLTASLAVLPPVLVLYGFAPSLPFALPALFVVGLVYIGVLSGLSTVVQLRAPAELHGQRAQPVPGRARRLLSDRFARSGTAGGLARSGLDDCGCQCSPGDRARRDAPGAPQRLPGARGSHFDRGWSGCGLSLIRNAGPAPRHGSSRTGCDHAGQARPRGKGRRLPSCHPSGSSRPGVLPAASSHHGPTACEHGRQVRRVRPSRPPGPRERARARGRAGRR